MGPGSPGTWTPPTLPAQAKWVKTRGSSPGACPPPTKYQIVYTKNKQNMLACTNTQQATLYLSIPVLLKFGCHIQKFIFFSSRTHMGDSEADKEISEIGYGCTTADSDPGQHWHR